MVIVRERTIREAYIWERMKPRTREITWAIMKATARVMK